MLAVQNIEHQEDLSIPPKMLMILNSKFLTQQKDHSEIAEL
jgi:hypothetical protein